MNTGLHPLPPIPSPGAAPDMADKAHRALSEEHGALLRQMATLQRRVSDHVSQQARRVAALEADNLRLRAELVRSRTALLWGLQPASPAVPMRRLALRQPAVPVVERPWREAQAVICQTGCTGHAHIWRDDQGQCRRSGEACQPHSSEAGESSASDPIR